MARTGAIARLFKSAAPQGSRAASVWIVPKQHYPLWVAMGAALLGTLLGGAAVYLGVSGRTARTAIDRESPMSSDLDVHSVEPRPVVAQAQPSPLPKTDNERLVEAAQRVDSSVVSIKIASTTRGAGVVYDEEGFVLTNYHVVAPVLGARDFRIQEDNPGTLTIRFSNGRELPGRVVAADGEEDIAVVKLEPADTAETFDAVNLGESSKIKKGQAVFVVGSPVGLDHTMSTGIVSALDRTEILPDRQLPLMQLDASINVGDSGGPLFDLDGALVGITTLRSNRAEGIGFAIPVDRVRAFLRALRQGDATRASVIEVEIGPDLDISQAVATLDYTVGLTVTEVFDGPAKEAGLRKDDVIVEIRGKRYDELGDGEQGRRKFMRIFGRRVRSLIPGESLQVTVVRDGATKTIDIVAAPASDVRQARVDSEELLGLVLAEERDEPVVYRVADGSAVSAYRDANELLVGAEITKVAGRPVKNILTLGEVLLDLKDWAREGGDRSVSLSFRDQEGEVRTVIAFPLTT